MAGPTSAQNLAWNPTISIGDYNSWIIDGNYGNPGGTGATQLSLPFINNALGLAGQPQPFEIIRRPPAGEVTTTALGSSRLYNEAEIRVMLSDNPAELSALGSADPNNIRLANFNDASNGVNYQFGVPATPVAGLPALVTGGTYNTYFATGSTGVPNPTTWTGTVTTLPADYQFSPIAPPAGDVTLFDANAPIITQGKDGLNNAPPAIALSTCNALTGVCAGSCAISVLHAARLSALHSPDEHLEPVGWLPAGRISRCQRRVPPRYTGVVATGICAGHDSSDVSRHQSRQSECDLDSAGACRSKRRWHGRPQRCCAGLRKER